MRNAASDLPTVMMATTAASCSGRSTTIAGSNNIPTETKNSTEKAFSSGTASAAMRLVSFDSFMTTPAKNAPSANETPKPIAEI